MSQRREKLTSSGCSSVSRDPLAKKETDHDNHSAPPDDDDEPSNTLSRWRIFLRRRLWVIGVVIIAAAGSIVAVVDATDYYFTSENFCAYSCHVMERTVYKELKQSKH